MSKCKIVFDYIQYDGLNGKEVAAFIKYRLVGGNMKFEWEEGNGAYDNVKKFMWKIYDPKQIKSKSAYVSAIYEGQYLVYNPKTKELKMVSLSVFKDTYELDDNDYSITITPGTSSPAQPVPVPYTPPIVPPYTPGDAPTNPWWKDVWCSVTKTGEPLPDTGNVVSSTEPKKEWVFGTPGIVDKK